MPRFARADLHALVQAARASDRRTAARVMLWPDTFNNYFRADDGDRRRRRCWKRSATRSPSPSGRSAAAGRSTTGACSMRPRRCGARRWTMLADEIAAGTPIVGLEPACVSAFRDELPGLFPDDERAERSEPADAVLHRIPRSATPATAELPQHRRGGARCRSIATTMRCSSRRREKTRARAARPRLRGAWHPAAAAWPAPSASRRDKYDVSHDSRRARAAAARSRAAPDDTLILANGFSCREQIEQGTGRETAHIAEVIARALNLQPGDDDITCEISRLRQALIPARQLRFHQDLTPLIQRYSRRAL